MNEVYCKNCKNLHGVPFGEPHYPTAFTCYTKEKTEEIIDMDWFIKGHKETVKTVEKFKHICAAKNMDNDCPDFERGGSWWKKLLGRKG